MATASMKKSWRTTVVRRLKQNGSLTDKCKIISIAEGCGTLITACGKVLKTGVSLWGFESLHHF